MKQPRPITLMYSILILLLFSVPFILNDFSNAILVADNVSDTIHANTQLLRVFLIYLKYQACMIAAIGVGFTFSFYSSHIIYERMG
jgi:NADH:ubiquinone oxidoreductase subunit K